MGEVADHEPLLLKKEDIELSYIKKTSLTKSSLKWILKITMWVVFVTWGIVIFLFPTEFMTQLYFKWIRATDVTLFGTTGSYFSRIFSTMVCLLRHGVEGKLDVTSAFVLFSAPILFIAFLGIVYVYISDEDEAINESKLAKKPSFRLWTFPVLVDGPFGVVSAGEMIGIILFIVYIVWALAVFTIRNYNLLPLFEGLAIKNSVVMLELTGLRFGFLGLICLAFLFLPVSRGSILLRLIDIPFEHATRYHVWLGHLTMFLFTLHGLFFVIGWAMQGKLIEELLEWKNEGVANLPGVIGLIAGLLMWVTSLPGVRRVNFELFFYTHQLYIVFIFGLALHVGDAFFSIAAAGIFMFMLDRFLRFWQSRTTVDVLSATCYPCGTLELILSKPANLSYNALGWIFLQVRELSWLQWHPFSVSSSPLDGKYHLAIMIKVLGDWTAKLKDQISISEKSKKEGKITVSVEGPYGHESPYHLKYENLILVAGGIGISPFLAILSDVLHRLKNEMPCLPKNILIVWAVKNSEELPLLKSVDIESICPSLSDKLNLEIQTYVTRESEPPLEEGKVSGNFYPSVFPASRGCRMSGLVGTGSVFWSGLYLVVSTIGLVISVGLVDVYYINPRNITYWWYKGLLLMGIMTASVLVFGGIVIVFWHLWERKASAKTEAVSDGENVCSLLQRENDTEKNSAQEQYSSSVIYGKRPDLEGIFGSMSERWGNVDIGVIICGPSTLQTSVAKECRRQNLSRRNNEPIFHFNSHSFDL